MIAGKTIAVTGIASGIGAATARFVNLYVPIDLADEQSIATAVHQVAEVYNEPIDALCNVAGVPPTVHPALVLQVNFLGLRAFTQAMIPHLGDGASIVNVASLAGIGWLERVDLCKELFALDDLSQANAFCTDFNIDAENCYEFSKEALIVWTMQCWNRWHERSIRINAVSPSAVDTPILDDFMQTVAIRAQAQAPGLNIKPRLVQPDEVAAVIAFLCSDESRGLNGINIPVDNGLLAARTAHNLSF